MSRTNSSFSTSLKTFSRFTTRETQWYVAGPAFRWPTQGASRREERGMGELFIRTLPVQAKSAPAPIHFWVCPLLRRSPPGSVPSWSYPDRALVGFVDFGSPISGDGQTAAVTDPLNLQAKFYRVLEITP